ncbi:hypothetical protein SD81_040270 [Tolypothrix campylonemoides VB511288]|nr:hypothetical protein SD81_040270 [Tolypothrix campylonemoides VB511288]
MNRQEMIRYGDLLEQGLIKQYQLNKIEAFYLFNSKEGDINERLNEILLLRDESKKLAEETDNDFNWLEIDEDLEHYLGEI